jgi:hypothetical protein
MSDGSACTGAVVGKPPGKEPAGDWRGCCVLYGDLCFLGDADDIGGRATDVRPAIEPCVGGEIARGAGAGNDGARCPV